MVAPALLHVSRLAAARQGRALFAPLSFTLVPGGALLVAGPNGSGKSTLLRTLAGLIPPQAGACSCSVPFTYLGHRNALHPTLTVAEHLSFWCGLAGYAPEPQLAARLGLGGLDARRAGGLSQGQQRRLALARLLAGQSPLWLLDEPHAALDRSGVDLLRTIIAAHRAQGGAVLLTSHGGLELPDMATLELAPADGSMAHDDRGAAA